MTLVSIIIPFFNAERYLKKCVDSIMAQSMQDWELILVNDASKDNSLIIAQDYCRKDKRIKVVSYDKNRGPMYAREKGCEIAEGEYVTFCDSDDTLPTQSVELFYKAAINHRADLVVGQFSQINEMGEVSSFPIKASLNYGDDSIGCFKSIMRFEMPQGLCGKLFKKEIVKEETIIYENVTMGEDAGVLFQYVRHISKAVVINDSVYNYIQHTNSSTHSTLQLASLEGICKLMKLRECIVKDYDGLLEDFNKYVIQCIIPLFIKYKKSLMVYLNKYRMDHYVSVSNICRYFIGRDLYKLLLQRNLFPFVYYVYEKIR